MKLQSVRLRALLIACAAAVLAAALLASAFGDRGSTDEASPRTDLSEGLVFSTDDGDPIDLYFGDDTPGTGCTNVGGFFYGSSVSCFDPDGAEGSYEVVIPESAELPPLVVGIMSPGASGALVQVGQTAVRADTRGRWFLAALEPGALGPNKSAPVSVEFSG